MVCLFFVKTRLSLTIESTSIQAFNEAEMLRAPFAKWLIPQPVVYLTILKLAHANEPRISITTRYSRLSVSEIPAAY
jgi:hypothetical protein